MPTNTVLKEKLSIKNGNVYLKLNNENRDRYLGRLTDEELKSHKRYKDVFRKDKSLAFNSQLLETINFEILHVVLEKSDLFITRKKANEIGNKRCYEEVQTFVPLIAFFKTKDEAIRNTSNGINFGNASMTKPVNFVNRDCTQIPLFS